jgi:HSP20 family protein
MAQRNQDLFPIRVWNDSSIDPFRRLFEDFFSRRFFETSSNVMRESGAFSPPADFKEQGDHYLLSLDLPGVRREDIHIEIQGTELTISGERRQEKHADEKGVRYAECSYGYFQRSMSLPPGVGAEQIEAEFHDGVLQVAIPKVESKGAQKVPIGESKSGFLKRILGIKDEGKAKDAPSSAA